MSVLDLGATPSCESFLSADQLDSVERMYPLHLRLCENCLLLQIPAVMTTNHTGIAGNVYDRIPDLVGFTRSLRQSLDDDGCASIEVHHALNLFELGLFDAVCHEHLQYFTLLSMSRVLATADLAVVDVESIETRGGSIRVWMRPQASAGPPSGRVAELLRVEQEAGLHQVAGYPTMRRRAESIRHVLLRFLLDCRAEGKRVVGYGASGKGGNTLLNYCGIRSDLLEYTVDRDLYKQGRFTPGTRIPIYEPDQIAHDRPDVVLALNWHLEGELVNELAYITDWGGELVVPLPTLHTTIPTSQIVNR